MYKYVVSIVLFCILCFNIPFACAQVDEDEYFYSTQERLFMDMAQYDKALPLFEKGLDDAKATNNQRDLAKYTKNIGDIYLKTNDYKTALTKYQEAFNILGNIEDKKLERAILHNIGVVYANQAIYDKAIAYYQKALDISKAINFTYGIISGYNNIGNLYFNQGEYDKARENLEQALEYAQKSNIVEYEISVLMNLSNIYNFTGQFEKAKVNYLSVLDKSRNFRDQSLYADTLTNLGILESNLGQYDNAVNHYKEALKIYEQKNDKKKLSQLYINLAVALYEGSAYKTIKEEASAFDETFNYLNLALGIALEINDIETALYAFRQLDSINSAIIGACGQMNKENENIQKNLQALNAELISQGKEDITLDIKKIEDPGKFCSTIQLDKATRDYIDHQMLLINDIKKFNLKPLLPDLYMSLAHNYYWLKDYNKTIEMLQLAITLNKELYKPGIWQNYYFLGKTYEEMNNNKEALSAYEAGIKSVLDIASTLTYEKDKTTYINTKQDLFKQCAKLKAESGDISGAMELIDLAKISEQSDYLAFALKNKSYASNNNKMELAKEALNEKTRASQISDSISQEVNRPQETQDPSKLDELRKQIQQTRLNFQQTALKLQQEYPDILKYVAVKPSNIRTIQSMLPEDAILIEPVVFDDKIIIFLGPPGQKVATYKEVKLDNVNMLATLISFRKALMEKDEKTLLTASSALYDVLIRPIEPDIAEYKVLVISPYENLRYIPFQALYDGQKFLVEKYSVVNATSASTLKIAAQVSVKNLNLLAFGNATEDLPASENEVKSIAKNFANSKIFLRSEAQKKCFDDEIYNDYKIIHLATHGILNNDDPDNSKLLFAGKENNFLTVADIMAYDFSNKDLIVLSACDSNIGKTKGAEISALGTAFEMAAAPTVIASLWKVNDQSTAILMQEFYKNLTAGDSKAESLRKAQISIINLKDFRNPYYWAPFVIMGEWK